MNYTIVKQSKFNPDNPKEITTETRYIDENGTIYETPPQLDLFNKEEGDQGDDHREEAKDKGTQTEVIKPH